MGLTFPIYLRILCICLIIAPPLTNATQFATAGPVERWRPLIAQHFAPEDIDRALCVIRHESRGNPRADNPRSSATGLWQHLARYWERRSAKAGIPSADIWDPEAQTIVAAWLVYHTRGGWQHWVVIDHC